VEFNEHYERNTWWNKNVSHCTSITIFVQMNMRDKKSKSVMIIDGMAVVAIVDMTTVYG